MCVVQKKLLIKTKSLDQSNNYIYKNWKSNYVLYIFKINFASIIFKLLIIKLPNYLIYILYFESQL